MFTLYFFLFLSRVCSAEKIPIGVLYDDEGDNIETVIKSATLLFNSFTKNRLIVETAKFVDVDAFKLGQDVCSLTEKGILATIGPENLEINEIVRAVSDNFQIPHFEFFWNPNIPRGSTNIFNVYPSPEQFSKALATLVLEMKWKGFTIIYEDDDSLIRLQDVIKNHRNYDYHVTIKKLHKENDQRSLLKEIKASSEAHIVLDCKTNRIMEILQQASLVNLMEQYHSYVLTSLDAHTLDFTKLKRSGTNITTLRMIDVDSKYIKTIVKGWEYIEEHEGRHTKISTNSLKIREALMYDVLNVLLTAITALQSESILNLPAAPMTCDEFKSSHNENVISEYIKVKPLINGTLPGPLTGPVHFDPDGFRKNFDLQIVEITKDDGFRLTGVWNSEMPHRIKSTFSERERQQEFLLSRLVCVTSRIGAPYLMFKENPLGEELYGNDRFEGYSIDLIDELAKLLNFEYEFQLVPDKNYGSYDPKTKEWNGLIRELLDRRADLAICDLTITYERGKAVDFSMPFMTLGISILYSKAVKEPPALLAFMHPLSLDIWLYMATAYLIISFFIYIAARLNPHDWENPHPCNEEPDELENIWSIKNSAWLTMGSIMAQGCDLLPKGISTRMIASMWWFFSLIITSSYTANLAAFLTMERMGPTIESAEDLAKQNDIKYGCLMGGATAAFFQNSNFSTYQRMWRSMRTAEPSVFEKTNKDGVKRVKNSKRMYAFLMESSSIEYEMERDCELMQVGGLLDIKGYGIAMPTNSPYRSIINSGVLKLQESGILRRLKDRWWKEKYGGGKCNETKNLLEDSATELGIDHVGGIFVVLTGGVFLALLIAIFEFLWNVRKISVEGQMTPRKALEMELKFAMNVSIRKKLVLKKSDEIIK